MLSVLCTLYITGYHGDEMMNDIFVHHLFGVIDHSMYHLARFWLICLPSPHPLFLPHTQPQTFSLSEYVSSLGMLLAMTWCDFAFIFIFIWLWLTVHLRWFSPSPTPLFSTSHWIYINPLRGFCFCGPSICLFVCFLFSSESDLEHM